MTILKKITSKAERLHAVRAEIHEREETQKKELDGLRAERDALQEELILELKKNKLTGVKVENGDNYTLARRIGITVVNEALALNWAIDSHAVSVNKIYAAQILKDSETMPRGIERSVSEYISVRKAANKE